ncbi:hypothetical protein MVLG_03402 [Microbotryum lychnidis-dioicae p1A1 Lamole]|uniref:Transcription elongation factor Spt6 n=1 Tax=Microbotryum lychnidis-dioicae (strain p1A1 Lamole / MvSl-1064) TaxID=683840 RepID=U5H835_USTV1|nr:hypothetical protein MVLG_03402 [Microbotryum lychnidis-dioicae p1A1 Lamole]|eukprot:KDE06243.1 hypothetical protein MVLG_03402 [Microbotryum lychnidis-dioicae p1A1 Lamole]
MSTSMLLGNPTEMDQDDDEDEDPDMNSSAGEGVDLMGDDTASDSSEEEDEDSEAEREVRKDFIVDEDETEESRKRRKKKHRKQRERSGSGSGDDAEQGGASRKRRKGSDDDDNLDEDDIDLLEENTGVRLSNRSSKGKLKRLRRRRSVGASDDDEPAGLNNLFDDDARGAGDDDDDGGLGLPFDGDEMAGFIEDDTASESDRQDRSDEDENDRAARKEAKRKARAQQSNRGRGRGFGTAYIQGISAEARQEVTEVFGNGQDYAWALDDEEDEPKQKELRDIYEPSEIASRMLTEEDEAIRALDIPERMQIASAGLPTFEDGDEDAGITQRFIQEEDLELAAEWMSTRISLRAHEHFIMRDSSGDRPPHHDAFITAIKNVVRFMNIELLEPPFIWAHRADYLVVRDGRDIALLDHDDLWRISALSIKYRALLHRKRELKAHFNQLEVEDDYFDETLDAVESVEEVSDANEWMSMKYYNELEQIRAARGQESDLPSRRRATRESAYQHAKKEFVSDLATQIGISATELARDFISGTRSSTTEDPSKAPLELAAEFTNDEFTTPERALDTAQMIAVHEIRHDPILRREIRRYFKDYAVVTVTPTDKGINTIDEMNPFYVFKYLKGRPVSTLLRSAMFLQILAAEGDDLVKCRITLPGAALNRFMEDLTKIYTSDYTSTVAEEWNKFRSEILTTVVQEHLLPFGERWARTYLREEEEDFVGRACKSKLEDRINVAPYQRRDGSMEHGEVPSVLAISNGEGHPQRDSVSCVFMDAEGHVREQLKVDNLHRMEDAQRESFTELLRRRRPQVVVIGGFSPNTNRLYQDFMTFSQGVSDSIVVDQDDLRNQDVDEDPFTPDQLTARAAFETIYVYDNVARLYQSSPRALIEFPELSTISRYCVALARYAQSPLNEYAALGDDLVALSYDPNQKYLSPAKIKEHLEHALIDVTNRCGVEINKAVRNAYYRHLLPYVAGLGPRKASGLVKKIESNVGGTLSNRSGLIFHAITTKNIFMNAAGFLRISQDDLNADLGRREAAGDEPEVLDDTRIHPEDYEVARKMAADAMEVDEEETATFKVPSQAVINLMSDNPRRLDDLSLDDFAAELEKLFFMPKRLTLYSVRDEMQEPYADRRLPFRVPNPEEVFAMLTGETKQTFDNGLIIPVRVYRFRPDGAICVRLESQIEGTIEAEYRTQDPNRYQQPRIGQTIQAQIIGSNLKTFTVELSTVEGHIQKGDADQRRVGYDPQYYDVEAARVERERQAIVQKKSAGRQKRMVNHPNFHNLSAGQAEEYLANMQRGDCVIRPSSLEHHIAVTWKVAEGVYQHIAVHEMNKANEWALGSLLRITKPIDVSQPNASRGEAYWSYSDLDELIVSHIKQMSLKVGELMAHDKFKGDKAALDNFLSNSLMVNPNISAYGFAINKDPKKPGLFMVTFRANDGAEPHSWPIWVVPGAFVLKGAEHGDVAALCNGFKRAYTAEIAAGGAGTRMPMRTPRYPGGATPFGAGGAAAAGGRTPNPLREQQAAAAVASIGAGTGRNPLFNSGRTPMGAGAGGRTPLVVGGRTPVVASGKTPIVGVGAGAGGRTPNPYASTVGTGKTPIP